MATAQMSFKRRHAKLVGKLRLNPTPAEHEFCSHLDKLGLGYRFQQSFFHPAYRIADFFIPSMNLIVEIDGGYHDAERDRAKDELFERERGIKTLRLTNEQVFAGELPDCLFPCPIGVR